MSKQEIKYIQNILKTQNRYDLALKLEGAYFEYYNESNSYSGFNNFGGVDIYVNSNHFFTLNSINDIDKELLLSLFNGLKHQFDEIVSLSYKIDTNISIENYSDTLYIFVDESGNRDFTQKGSKYFMFNFLMKKRPFNLHNTIANYRYTLLEKNLDPFKGNDRRLNIEYFHASKDNRHIRENMLNLITTFDKESVQIYSYILEKPKVDPTKREEIDKFYIDNLTFAITQLLKLLAIDKNFIVITDRLPLEKNEKLQAKALKQGIAKYIEENNLELRYDIFHHCSASSTNLQIVDYISWAIFRKYEHNDDKAFQKIKKYIIKMDDMTKLREKLYYKK